MKHTFESTEGFPEQCSICCAHVDAHVTREYTIEQLHRIIGPALLLSERDHKYQLFAAIADGSASLSQLFATELVRIERALSLIYQTGKPFPGDDEPVNNSIHVVKERA